MAKKKKKTNPQGKSVERRARAYEQINAAKAKARSERKQAVPYIKDAIKAAGHGMEIPLKMAIAAGKGALKGLAPGDKEKMTSAAWKEALDTNPLSESIKLTKEYYKGAGKAMKHLGKAAFNDIKAVGKTLFNDLSWYNHYPESTMEMIGPNFNVRMGTSEELLDTNANATCKPSLPSFASIMLNLTRGDDTDKAVTAAINRIYTTIRQANAGQTNWDPYQLDAYIYNYRLIIALYSVACRALKNLNKYSVVDNNVPYGLFASLGVDYDDLKNNAPNLRNALLMIRNRLMTYAIPSFDVLKRTYWLFSNGFTDSDDIKHQTYHFVPYITQLYSMSSNALISLNPNFSPYVPTTSPSTGVSVSTIISVLSALANEFYGNDVYSIISGDIVKAYGVENLFILDRVPTVDEQPTAGYNEEVLSQIQNLYVPRTGQGSTYSITLTHANTDDVGLTEGITYVETGYANIPNVLKYSTFLNTYINGVSNLDVLGATRLIGLATSDTSTFTLSTYGTEIVEKIRYYVRDTTIVASHKIRTVEVHNLQGTDLTTEANVETNSLAKFCWATFDWSPRIVEIINFYKSGATATTASIGATLFDFNNYAKIQTIEQLRNIHNVALQSLYYSPLLSRVSTNLVELPSGL